MVFIRVKKFKRKNGIILKYAYLVKNKRYKRTGKVKQEFKKYLGKLYSFSKVNDSDFFEFFKIEDSEEYTDTNKKERIIKDLVEWEFYKHSIDKEEFIVDFKQKKVLKGSKEVSLKLNEGLLNSYTLGRLLRFRFTGEEREDGFKMAKYFVEAGIEVPKEVFVGIFNKVYK